jgi:NodT family efflux transporter outer membrane factor (OMF) lipoprotein
LYNDPHLTKLVQEALTANNDIKVAVANLARANAGLDVARDARNPQLSVQGGPSFGRNSAEEKVAAGPLKSAYAYSMAVAVSYQVDLFGEVQRAIESAGADADAAQATVASTRLTVAAQAAQSFIAACSAGRELETARTSIALQEKASELARRQFKAGRANSMDERSSLTLEERLAATLPVFAARQREALFRLAVLTGRPPSEFPSLLGNCKQEPRLASPIPTGDGRALLARRPDVARAEAQLRAATADLGVATAQLYPRIQFGVSGGSVGQAQNFLKEDTLKFSIGPLVSWEMPNRARAQGRIGAAQASIDAAYARFDGAVLTALQEVESALNSYQHDMVRFEKLSAAVETASQSSRDSRRLYSEGRDSFLAVLQADQQLLQIQQDLAAQQTTIANDQIRLFLTLGGGWGKTEDVKPRPAASK